MSTKERVLVLVRATPEKSKKYGYRICVAGINENGEWRRLYPFQFEPGKRSIDFRKKDIIEVEVVIPQKDKRKESRKVLSHHNLNSPLRDDEVVVRLTPLITSIEKLEKEKASLGVIKPDLLNIYVKIHDMNIYDEQTYLSLMGDFLERREKVKIPIEVRYRFRCSGEEACKGHTLKAIDWEINELSRKLLKKYDDKYVIEEKLRQRLWDFMRKRDLYFFVGMHNRWKTWLIIGMYYPDKRWRFQKKLISFWKR